MHALLLALALSLPVDAAPLHVAPHVRESISVVAGCGDLEQPYIVITNVGHEPLLLEWLCVSEAPPWPTDVYAGAGVLAPGQFEGWLTSGLHLRLSVQFNGHVRTVEASCP